MQIIRNAAIMGATLALGMGAVAHANDNHHGDTPTGYYGQPSGNTRTTIGHTGKSYYGPYGSEPSSTQLELL